MPEVPADPSLAASWLRSLYGIETGTGSRILAFDCPWIQGRNDEGGGRTSHCLGGMFQIVEVLAEETVLQEGYAADDSGGSSSVSTLWASTVAVVFAAVLL